MKNLFHFSVVLRQEESRNVNIGVAFERKKTDANFVDLVNIIY